MDLGTIFRVTPDGTLTTLFSFDGDDGRVPSSTLTLGNDGDLYGVALGGTIGPGTIFRFSVPSGVLTVLHNFTGDDGSAPSRGLVQADDGNFYGTTYAGTGFQGEVFRITPGGRFTVLHKFEGGENDGSGPLGLLTLGSDGNLYGTTGVGGNKQAGDVFKISTQGVFSQLASLCADGTACPNGSRPAAGVIQGADGDLYGAASSSGNLRCLKGLHGCGTLYKLATGHQLSLLHTFDLVDGADPVAELYQATDGNFYGGTYFGGQSNCTNLRGCGVLYRLTSDGSYSVIYDLCSVSGCLDGAGIAASVIQGTDGNLYGMTIGGGPVASGTIYRVSLGLPPFVKTLPTAAQTGTIVRILGNNLTGTTSVTFHGVPSTFAVISDTLITTAVPAGATSGSVQVTSATGTLTSNVPFRVLQ